MLWKKNSGRKYSDGDFSYADVFYNLDDRDYSCFSDRSAGFLDILFETTSAIGTVGLSTGLTPALHTASKFVIMILMYAGRIGPVTMALAFGLKKIR